MIKEFTTRLNTLMREYDALNYDAAKIRSVTYHRENITDETRQKLTAIEARIFATRARIDLYTTSYNYTGSNLATLERVLKHRRDVAELLTEQATAKAQAALDGKTTDGQDVDALNVQQDDDDDEHDGEMIAPPLPVERFDVVAEFTRLHEIVLGQECSHALDLIEYHKLNAAMLEFTDVDDEQDADDFVKEQAKNAGNF